jgi:hypothetical protein
MLYDADVTGRVLRGDRELKRSAGKTAAPNSRKSNRRWLLIWRGFPVAEVEHSVVAHNDIMT